MSDSGSPVEVSQARDEPDQTSAQVPEQPLDDQSDVPVSGTLISDDTTAVQITFEPFSRVPPPPVPQAAVHEVDIEPDSDTFVDLLTQAFTRQRMLTKVPITF